jgi:predicted nucleic acid-binding protein
MSPPLVSIADYGAAASPCGTIDCIIAQTCITAGLELLSTDQDFAAIARHTPLRLCTL